MVSDKFRELLDAYWSAAYDQGVSQTSHDDENRTAENAELAVLEYVNGLTAALAEARDKALEEAAKVVLRELSECGEAVNAIDAVDFPTETQQWNRHFYRGGYRASANIAAAIRALKEKP